MENSPLVKKDGWVDRLKHVIESHRYIPYDSGITDCFLFMCKCVYAITEIDFSNKFEYHSYLEGLQIIERLGGMESAISTVLKLTAKSGYEDIQTGDIALFTDKRMDHMGIVYLPFIVFPGKKGLDFIPINLAEKYWRID